MSGVITLIEFQVNLAIYYRYPITLYFVIPCNLNRTIPPKYFKAVVHFKLIEVIIKVPP